MTREEIIAQNADIASLDAEVIAGYDSEDKQGECARLIRHAYCSGADWADAHPLFGWHDIKEETPSSGMFFVHERWGYHSFVIVAEYRAEDDEWRPWDDIQVVGLPLDKEQRSRITHWMPIPAIPHKDDEHDAAE